MRRPSLHITLFCLLFSAACSRDGNAPCSTSGSSTGDGDGDTGEPTGDGDAIGDGDSSAGDGDTGQPPGDGDTSETSGDGDTGGMSGDGDTGGTTPGDGDGMGGLEPYSDPADGGCLPTEEALTIPGVVGSVCAQPCENFTDPCEPSDFGGNTHCMGSEGEWDDFSGLLHCFIRCSDYLGFPCEDGAQCARYGLENICTW